MGFNRFIPLLDVRKLDVVILCQKTILGGYFDIKYLVVEDKKGICLEQWSQSI